MKTKSNMTVKVEVSKIICFPKEGEIYKPSLISIGKYDWEISDNKVTKRKYMVYINLWIIQLFFNFILPVKQNK